MSSTSGKASLLASTFAFLLSGVAAAQQFSDVVAFGDSLSDNGNLYKATGFPPPPYWEGRYTNGRVWVEQLANSLAIDPDTISDFAVIGATTSDVLNLQVAPFVAAHGGAIDPNALYTVWVGPNDFLAFMQDPNGDPVVMISNALDNIGSSIGLLLASGARHVMVPNMPDLTVTPFIRGIGDPVLSAQLLTLVQAFNGGLAQVVGALDTTFGVQLIQLDSFDLLDEIVASPASFDLKNATDLAFPGYLDGTTTVVKKPDDYLFWNDFHPTRVGHTIFASRAVAALGLVWADLDGSGVVDSQDIQILVHSYGTVSGGSPYDLNADGVIDATDLQLLQEARH